MKRALSLLSILAVLLFAGSALAEENDFYIEDDEGPVFYITLPDGWSGEWQEEEELNVLHAMPKDESIYLSIVALQDATDPEASGALVDAILTRVFSGYNFEAWKETTTTAGVPLFSSESTATVKKSGAEVKLSARYFVPKKDVTYVLYYFGTPAAFDARKGELEAIVDTLRTEE